MFTTRPELTGTFGAVASTHYLASSSGMAVLETGGNAYDAAVATAFVLHVVEPHLNGPGGDAPIMLAHAGKEPVVLCGQAPAPAGATIAHYRSEGLETVPGTGLLAPSTPGAVPAWLTLLRDHGTLPLGEVLKYAIGYARHGHPVIARVAGTIASMADYFTTHWPTSAAQWLPHGRAPQATELVTNEPYARTLERLCAEAAAVADRAEGIDAALRAWSHGFVAEAISRFVTTPVRDSSGADHAGVMTADDLASWSPTYEEPVSYVWRGSQVYKCDRWSQGPVLLQQLALLDPLLPERADDWTVDIVHHAIEAAKLAFADRDAYHGDSGDDLLDVAELLDPAYLDQRRALITGAASEELRPGRPGGREPRLASAVRRVGAKPPSKAGIGEPTVKQDDVPRGDTCHIDVVDRWGNVVSATPSGGWLQASPYIPEVGFCLGSRLQMCWLEEGLPSSLQPGRRPRTTLSPSMSVDLDTGRTTGFGTPGGDQQDQWQLVFLLAHTVLGRNLQESIDSPAWHSEAVVSSFDPRVWRPLVVAVESRMPAGVLDGLRERGHTLEVGDPWSLGRLSAASYEPRTGLIRSAANPRGMQGYAVSR
ncbi:gamma-glutamyltransferase family protein [Cumulibacter manganitolerans]|uniref:gamma-glutamyltransferase family protein n=1 Tax=Cumulibacter manganitolerans TaxID=1884992 RepID=UPI001295DAE5|nr:gamma-glutamyltransferase [Cumulibacter manganitolerans]